MEPLGQAPGLGTAVVVFVVVVGEVDPGYTPSCASRLATTTLGVKLSKGDLYEVNGGGSKIIVVLPTLGLRVNVRKPEGRGTR